MRTFKSNQLDVHYDEKIDCIMKIMAIAPIEVFSKKLQEVLNPMERMLLIKSYIGTDYYNVFSKKP